MMEGLEQPNQEKIRKLGEMEAYKYLWMLETDTIQYAEMKENIKMNASGERENYSKPNDITVISSKE